MFRALFLIIIAAAESQAAGVSETVGVTVLADLVKSPEWDCSYTHKVNLPYLSNGSLDKERVFTFVRVSCVGQGKQSGTEKVITQACPAPGRATAYSLSECADLATASRGDFAFSYGIPAADSKKKGKDKHGRTCRYDAKFPIVFTRKTKATRSGLDALCATPIKCDNYNKGPKHFLVACDGVSVTKDDKVICPQVNDCVENELPLTTAYTESELVPSAAATASKPAGH